MEETTNEAPSTRAIGVKWGVISAVIGIVFFLGMQFSGQNPLGGGWIIGSIRFAIGIAILVLAQNAFKNEGDGFMSYGQGFAIGFWQSLVSLLIAGAFTYIYVTFIDLSVMDLFYEDQAEQMRAKGQNEDAIEMAQVWTKKLFWVFFFVVGFIFSLIIPLVVTIITQKKNPQADMMLKNPLDISIIIPAKDEQESIPELSQWINRVMETHGFSFEVIFIDDGSEDNTWQEMVKANEWNPSFKAIRFNRNFGKSAALHTGFKAAQGDVVITMDADLQDSPDEIPLLYKMIREQNFQLISGWKKKRHDPITKTLPSRFFNFVTRRISGISLHDFNCGLKAYQSVVVKNITVFGEMHRYIPVIAKWAGFTRIGEKVVEHRERKYGHTKFGWERFMRGFLDLLTITFIGKFAKRPMHFFGTLGFLSFLVGTFFTLKILWDKLDSVWISKIPLKRDVTEQPIFYLALVTVILGVQLFLTGFIAELIARQSVSKRDYLVIEKVGLEPEAVQAEGFKVQITR